MNAFEIFGIIMGGIFFLLAWTIVLGYYIVPWVLSKTERPPDRTELVIDEFRSIIHSPSKKGHLGEEIVRFALEKLPKGMVTEKFQHPDLKGIPDFAVEIGDLKLIIDSKFTVVDNMQYLVKRGFGIAKYITPGLTYPFVLMWIPEPAMKELEIDATKELINEGVIPCTTSGMVSMIFLINYARKFFDIEEKYSDIREWFDRMSRLDTQGSKVYTTLGVAQKQLQNGMTNMKKAKAEMEAMDFDY